MQHRHKNISSLNTNFTLSCDCQNSLNISPAPHSPSFFLRGEYESTHKSVFGYKIASPTSIRGHSYEESIFYNALDQELFEKKPTLICYQET